jgi:Spy/CpxP family protein refolding chaperone
MRNWKKAVMAAALAAVLAAVFALPTVWSDVNDEVGGPTPFGEGRPLLQCFKGAVAKLKALRGELNLTPEQKAQIGRLLVGRRPEIVKTLRNLNEKHKVLLAAVRADRVDEAAIRAAARGMGEAIGDASVLRAGVRKDVIAALTPEQRGRVNAVLDSIQQDVDRTLQGLPE